MTQKDFVTQALTGFRYPTRPELFSKYPTCRSQKLKMTEYQVVSISFLKQQNAAWNGKWQIQLTLTLKIMISSFIEKSDVEQVQIFLLVPLELK